MPETKICKSCFNEKPLSDYYFRKDTNAYKNVCKRCFIDGKILKDNDFKLCKHFSLHQSSAAMGIG